MSASGRSVSTAAPSAAIRWIFTSNALEPPNELKSFIARLRPWIVGKPTFWYTRSWANAAPAVSRSASCSACRKTSTVRVFSRVCSVMITSLTAIRGAGHCGRVWWCASRVVAGPAPGHSFPAIALCGRFSAAGDTPTLLTGTEWLDTARAAGVDAVELAGLDPTDDDDDGDAGAKIHQRAARMAVLNVPQLQAMGLDLVVSDVITACGGMSAELLGIPWIEID